MSQVSSSASRDLRTPWYYKSTLDAARKMYRSEGIGAFYSGLSPALLGLTHVAIQFPLYEYFKMQFTGLEMGENSKEHQDVHWLGILGATFLSKICATSATYPHEVLRTRLQTQQRMAPHHSDEGISFRGGLGHNSGHMTSSSDGMYRPSRLLGSLVARSAGLVSSDGMISPPRYRGVVRTCRTIFREEGWQAFYRGMGTNMLRAVPAAMTTMITYESLKNVIYSLQVEGRSLLGEEG